MRRIRLALSAALLSLGAFDVPRAAVAGDLPAVAPAPVDRLTLSTERVVIFKDGYGLFVKSGTATADADGHVFTDAVPDAAVLGCFWAAAEGRKVLGLHAGWVETKTTRERTESCLSVLDLLRANVNRDVALGLTKEVAANVKGVILGLLETTPPPPAPPPPGSLPPPSPDGTSVVVNAPIGGTYVLLDVAGMRSVLPVAEVRTVSAPDLATTIVRHETVTTRTKRLTIDLGKEAAGAPSRVQLFYFTPGVRWIPTYRVSGTLDKDAEMSLSGEVIDDVEDVVDAAIDLVVGVPSFRFAEVVSPLSLETALVGAMSYSPSRDGRRRADRQLMGQTARMDNAFSNDAGPNSGAGAADGSISAAPELATEALQDLFLYSLPRVTIRRGDRAALSLWQSTVPLNHIYTADVVVIRNHRDGEGAYRSAKEQIELSSDPQASSAIGPSGKSIVWHELELTNKSAVPWTTGAALVTRGPLPIAQNILGYTSPGATTKLPLTVAVDVQAKWTEVELERRPKAVQWAEHTMNVVSKRGTLTFVNRRKDPSPMRITVSLGGKAETASDGGRITINDGRRADWAEWPWSWWGYVTNHSDVTWELTLAPGETKTLTVEFTFPLP